WRLGQRDGRAAELCGHRLRALDAAVREHHGAGAGTRQMTGAEFGCLAGADEQCPGFGQIGEYALGKLYSGVGNGYRMGTNVGVRANLLGDGETVLEQVCE